MTSYFNLSRLVNVGFTFILIFGVVRGSQFAYADDIPFEHEDNNSTIDLINIEEDADEADDQNDDSLFFGDYDDTDDVDLIGDSSGKEEPIDEDKNINNVSQQEQTESNLQTYIKGNTEKLRQENKSDIKVYKKYNPSTQIDESETISSSAEYSIDKDENDTLKSTTLPKTSDDVSKTSKLLSASALLAIFAIYATKKTLKNSILTITK